jgi:glycosyltransferase involved in cell wall biosynthesis
MNVALVHDYFTQMGGAERVVEAFYRLLPDATVFTTVSNPARLPEDLRRARIQTSWMQSLPGVHRLYRHYFLLYPLAVASLDLRGYDLVISSSSGYAKGVRVDRNAMHICYCHTPMRWVWRYDDYTTREGFGRARRALLPFLIQGLKRWDENAARQPDQYVANSRVVAERIWTAYHREAVVIPPPIDVHRFRPGPTQDDFYLIISRLVGYKRIDLAVEACSALKRRLIVIGDGPDRQRLERLKGPTVQFLGRQPDEVVRAHASSCRALLFPGEEDFGMVPLEVNAAGRPVVAYRGGAAVETVIDGTTGVFFERASAESLAGAIERFETMNWSASDIRAHAESFGTSVFESRFMDLLSSVMPGFERLSAAVA